MLCVFKNIRPELVPIRDSQSDVCTHLAITSYQQLMIEERRLHRYRRQTRSTSVSFLFARDPGTIAKMYGRVVMYWVARESRRSRQRGVLGCIVELLRGNRVWRVLLLPGYRSPYFFITFDQLAVTQFRPNPFRASNYVLRRVAGQQQMFWHVLPW